MINIGKLKFFFVKDKECAPNISKISLIFQFINYLICFVELIFLILYILLQSYTIFAIIIRLYLAYLALTFISLVIIGIISVFIDEKFKKQNKPN